MSYYDINEMILDDMHDGGWFDEDPEEGTKVDLNVINWSIALAAISGAWATCIKIMERCHKKRSHDGWLAANAELDRVKKLWSYAAKRQVHAKSNYK